MLPEALSRQINICQVDPYVDCEAIGEDRIVIYNGQTREEAFAFPIPKAREINIRKLRVLCAEQLSVQYGKKFDRYETTDSGVRVDFDDGSSDEGDIVIGIDGAMSKVRQCLLGRMGDMDILPFALMNFNASYTAEQARFIKDQLHPLVDIAIHPAGHYIRANILDMPDKDDPTKWTFQILSTWPLKVVEDHDNEIDRLRRLKEHVRKAGWAEPYKSAIECIPEDTEVLRDQLKIWKTVPWDNRGGRVTLCGDAAHAMTFRMSSLPSCKLEYAKIVTKIVGKVPTTHSTPRTALSRLSSRYKQAAQPSKTQSQHTTKVSGSVARMRSKYPRHRLSSHMMGWTTSSIAR